MKINKNQLKIFCIVLIVLNLISVILGVIYYALSTTALWWLWNLQGIIMIISWLLNMMLVYINDRVLNKSDRIGRKINLLSYSFLVFTIIAMLLLFFYTFIGSLVDFSLIIDFILALLACIGIAIFGISLAYFDIRNLENRSVWKFE